MDDFSNIFRDLLEGEFNFLREYEMEMIHTAIHAFDFNLTS